MAERPGWQDELQALQGRLEALAQQQIQAWTARWENVYTNMRWNFGRGEQERTLAWLDGRPADLQSQRGHFQEAIDSTRRSVDWLAANPIDEVRERLQRSYDAAAEALRHARDLRPHLALSAEEQRIDEAIGIVTSPDYQGQLAGERFYQEQDPASQWYRADLYHGEMGPDVRADYERTHEEERQGALEEMALGEAEMRSQAAEQRFAEQEQAFDEDQLRIAAGEPMSAADVDNWEHPFEFPTEAEQQAYEDRHYDLLEERAHFGEEMERSLPYDAILVDTSNPQMDEGFQALLARLDQRLEALIKETEAETHQLQHHQRRGY